ncbi:SDR family NAD(P)-dependent oxidoreductase [Microbacterium sp. P5_E9]
MTTVALPRTLLLAGGTSAVGAVVARAALDRGDRVVIVGRDETRLASLERDLPGIVAVACDLTDEPAVFALAERLLGEVGRVDGLLHLVGGWRGGGGLAGQTEADYRFLEVSFTALRNVTRAFDADLRDSDAGRLAIVSSTAVARPLAGGANYAAVKAASEAWTRAVAQGFAKAAREAGEPLRAASVIFRVKELDGLEHTLADAFVGLFAEDAGSLNDTVIDLTR